MNQVTALFTRYAHMVFLTYRNGISIDCLFPLSTCFFFFLGGGGWGNIGNMNRTPIKANVMKVKIVNYLKNFCLQLFFTIPQKHCFLMWHYLLIRNTCRRVTLNELLSSNGLIGPIKEQIINK